MWFYRAISDLPQAKETLSVNKITYICDFSRCGLNTRLYTLVSKPCSEATNIGYFIYWELSLAAYANSEIVLRKIWGRLQTVVAFWGIEILEDWHLINNYTIMALVQVLILWNFISQNFYISCLLPQITPTDFLSCQRAELLKINKAYLWPRSKVWMWAL